MGSAVVSASGFTDVSTAHAMGTTHTTARTVSTATQATLKRRVAQSAPARAGAATSCVRSITAIALCLPLLPADDPEPDGGDRQHDQEEHHRDGRRVADAVAGEPDVVDVLDRG